MLGSVFRGAVGLAKSPLARGALEYGAYSYGASALSEYANNNFEHGGSKTVANFAAGALRFKGAHSLFMGGTRTIGQVGSNVGSTLQSSGSGLAQKLGRGVSRVSNSLRPAGTDTRFIPGARTGRYEVASRSTGPDGMEFLTYRAHRTSRAVKTKRAAGSIDSFLSGLSPEKLMWQGAKLGVSGASQIGALPLNAAKGTGEYIRLASRVGRASRAAGGGMAGNRAGWSTLGMGLSSMRHEAAPFLVGGLALGGVNAFANRYQPRQGNMFSSPMDWEEKRFSMPLASDHGEGALGSVDPSNFPAGITMGRGRSAIRSQTVMEGQAAVTAKMVTRRRV